MDNLKLAELLFKDLDLTVADIEKNIPARASRRRDGHAYSSKPDRFYPFRQFIRSLC